VDSSKGRKLEVRIVQGLRAKGTNPAMGVGSPRQEGLLQQVLKAYIVSIESAKGRTM
jgi:hypothetical protein